MDSKSTLIGDVSFCMNDQMYRRLSLV
jgi:hypothetical protein